MTTRYRAEDLRHFAFNLLSLQGMHPDPAQCVAETLVEGDLLGHSTHGLRLLPSYLEELTSGTMTGAGRPSVLKDHGTSVLWDGGYLPGPWLVKLAIDAGLERLPSQAVFTANIQQSHHIACLEAYLERVARQGYLIILATSDPALGAKVAPFGGRTPVYTPNPLAAAWPIKDGLVMLDICMSTTSISFTQRLSRRKQRLPGKWVLDAEGRPSDDPAVVFRQPSGAILPLGGLDLGHKGFALGLLVEALTSGLCGFGRKDTPGRWGATVFLMMIDPEALGGLASFVAETTWTAEACLQAEALDRRNPVRLPGQAALAHKRRSLSRGLALEKGILPALERWSAKLEVAMPDAFPVRS
jgi:L-lactate dehydrogenase